MAAKYQYPSDGQPGMPPYSGVIRGDGRWVPNDKDNEDWQEYLEWAKDPNNHCDPYRSPADGGVAIKLQEGEEAVGCMVDSLPPEPTTSSAKPEQFGPPAPPAHTPPPTTRDKK